MRRFTRFVMAVALAVVAGRAVLFGVYAWSRFFTPTEAFHLESKMVHLAWRVAHGVRFYPDWQAYPHVANFFGPLYFGLVGLVGGVLNSSIEGLFTVGRAVTVGSVVAAAGLTFAALRSRYGTTAALLGALLGGSAGPLFGFGLMVRPDAFSDLLGLAGFLVLAGLRPRPAGVAPGRSGLVVAGVLLVAAVLAKQTTAVYALAGALALALDGHPRRALGWLAAVLGTLAAIVAAVTLLYEPNFGPSLMAEGKTPWDLAGWSYSMWRLMILDPEFPVLIVAGVGLWLTAPRREVWPLALAFVLIGSAVVTLAKLGSDMNYFLGVRHVAAWAGATMLHAATDAAASARRRGVALLAGVALLGSLYTSMAHSLMQAEVAYYSESFHDSRQGLALQALYRQVFQVAENPRLKLLTDSGFIDIRQGDRTVYGDPWLFRMLVETGQIQPETMRRWVEDEAYDQVITTKPLDDPTYETYDFGLPMPLVEAARRHYVLVKQDAGLFFYRPRREVLPPLTPGVSP
jgi:hypothetical protein